MERSRDNEVLGMPSLLPPLLHPLNQSAGKPVVVLQSILEPRCSACSPHGPILRHHSLWCPQKPCRHVDNARSLLAAIEYRRTAGVTERPEHILRGPIALGGSNLQIGRWHRREVIHRDKHPPDDMGAIHEPTVVAEVQTCEPLGLVWGQPTVTCRARHELVFRSGDGEGNPATVTLGEELLVFYFMCR